MCIRINWITQLNQTEGKGRLRHKEKNIKKEIIVQNVVLQIK